MRSLKSETLPLLKWMFYFAHCRLFVGCILSSAMCYVNLFAISVFLILHIFRPWHFEQRTKKNYWRHCFTLLHYCPFEEYWNYFRDTHQLAGKPLHIELCILQVVCLGFTALRSACFIYMNFREGYCTFFSVTLWISLLVSSDRYFSLYRSLLWEFQL